MNILIVGEYSSFSRELKKGFTALGHKCTVFSWGDGFKKIKQESDDYCFDISNSKIFSKTIRGSHRFKRILSGIRLKLIIRKLFLNGVKYDSVLVINQEFLRLNNDFTSPFLTWNMLLTLVKDPNNIFLSLCGNDYVFDSFIPNLPKFNPKYLTHSKFLNQNKSFRVFEFFKDKITKVIPTNISYATAYRNSKLAESFIISKTIPLPIYCANFNFQNVINDRIIIFHGVRDIYKGSHLIKEAMNRIGRAYPNDVEIITVGNLPLAEYQEYLTKANIVIDQCFSMDYGMNALYSLARGKIVLSGNHIKLKEEFCVDSIPIIDIKPDVDHIYYALESLLQLNKKELMSLAQRGFEFVNKMHDARLISQKYIDVFHKC